MLATLTLLSAPEGELADQHRALRPFAIYAGHRSAELPEWISVDTAGCTCRQVDHLIDVVGPDRVLLGTDLPAGRRPAIAALLEGLESSPANDAISERNPSALFDRLAVR